MSTPDPAHFENLLRTQLVLLKIEQSAPNVFRGLNGASFLASRSSSSPLPLDKLLEQIAGQSPALAEEARITADAIVNRISK
jgi:hypothetical protein